MNKNIHLVGGAVRDMLMGLEPKDQDYVVVGSSPEEMIAEGFVQVGQDFPVFLKDGDEYALARAERKTGVGYVGFEFEWKGVTLEDDLSRRDLTINSISMQRYEDTEFFVPGDEGNFVVYDPYGGVDDIHAKILRHTSDAFAEDPVRVLRLARLRARFGPEWKVAPETVAMISEMSKKGVLAELQPERVWKEFSRAIMETHPRLFFDTLLACDALHTTFPLVYKLLTALESHRWHPEGNAYEHTMLVLTACAEMGGDVEDRFACLCHDLGKGLTPFELLPRHHGHDINGVPLVDEMAKVMAVPATYVRSARLATEYHMAMHSFEERKATTIVKMFDALGANQQNTHAEVLRMVGASDWRGRLGSENDSLIHLKMYDDMLKAYRSVKFANVFPNGVGDMKGDKVGEYMYRARVAAVKKAKGGNVED